MKKEIRKGNRRTFIAKAGVITGGVTLLTNKFSAASYNRIIGANEKIRMGFIGVGNRGSQLLQIFMDQADCEIAGLCDVYEPYVLRDRSKVNPRYLEDRPMQVPQMGEAFQHPVGRYSDYKKLLENKDIDAVCIATPDHWHALMTVDAIRAGKDVYVEKPLSKTIREGREMVNVGKNSKQIITVGLNRRGAPTFQKLAKEIPQGKIGKITFTSAGYVSNMFPSGIGKMKPEDPPKDFNWEAWLGPRPYRPYQYNIAPYMFRWWNEYCNQICNQGVHYLDLIRWMLNEQAPLFINSHGGRLAVEDDRTIPDTMQVTYEFPSGSLVTLNILEASSGNFIPYGFIEMRGTKGTLYTDENDYKIIPTSPGQFQSWKKLMEAEEYRLEVKDKLLRDNSYLNSTANLVRNFLDCVKSRQKPISTLEEGHRSTSLAHMATISMIVKQRLQWDPVNERFTNSEEGNKLLDYEYREPYKLT